MLIVISMAYPYSYEIGARLCGAIEIARIAELALVEVVLEAVEDILHACIQL